MLLVGINILDVVWEQISEQMEMFSSETARGSFHGVDCRWSRKGGIFLLFLIIFTRISVCGFQVFSAHECFIFRGTFFKVRVVISFNNI